MAKLTNNTSGPKAIPTTDQGVVILEAGETADLNVADNDLKAITNTGMLDKDGTVPSIAEIQRNIASSPVGHLEVNADTPADGKGAKPKAFASMNRAELDAEVESAKATGFELPEDATTNAKIADALQAHANKAKAGTEAESK